LHEGVRIVAGVADQRFAICLREQLLGDRHLVPLARRQRDVERAALRVDDGMELCRKTSSRAAQSIAFDPPFPPEESWCARITEPSTIEPVSSSSNFSSRKNRGPVVLASPVCESVVDALPRPEALGQVAPRKAGLGPEQDSLDEQAVAADCARPALLGRKHFLQSSPWIVPQRMAMHESL
jgi:hypothetical protein